MVHVFGWDAAQELALVSHKCAVLDTSQPPEFKEARQVAALAACTSAEAIMVSALVTNKQTKEARMKKIQESMNKFEEQERTYGFPVRSQIHETVMAEAKRFVLAG